MTGRRRKRHWSQLDTDRLHEAMVAMRREVGIALGRAPVNCDLAKELTAFSAALNRMFETMGVDPGRYWPGTEPQSPVVPEERTVPRR